MTLLAFDTRDQRWTLHSIEHGTNFILKLIHGSDDYLGKCIVDETEKGWFIQLIDRKPESIQRQEALAKKTKLEKDDEERNQKLLEQQIERAAKAETNPQHTIFTELQRQSEEEKVAFKIGGAKSQDGAPVSSSSSSVLTEKLSMRYNIIG